MSEGRHPSLVLRIALGVATIMTVTVLGAVIFIYGAITHTIRAGIDQDLANAVDLVIHRLDEDHYPINKELLDLGEHLQLRIYDKAGRTLLESPGMTPLPLDLCLPGPAGRQIRESVRTHKGETAKLINHAWSGGLIQVLRIHQSEDALLLQFRHLLMAVVGVVPLLSGGLGYLLTRWNLRPVRDLAIRTQAIEAATLKAKIPEQDVPVELLALVHGLNGALDRLDDSFTRLGELNGDMAHELRTPLHGMRLELEALLDQAQIPEVAQESLARIIENLDHFSALIQQILFLAQAEDPNAHIRREPVRAETLMTMAKAAFEPLAEECGVSLVCEGGDFVIQGDPTLLGRVFHNLIGNAIRHTPRGGLVSLIARQEGAFDVLEVADSGSGIPETALNQLGNRFFRVDPSRAHSTGGTGLGLAIVRGIAHLHGGDLVVESRIGVGSRIGITLPRA